MSAWAKSTWNYCFNFLNDGKFELFWMTHHLAPKRVPERSPNPRLARIYAKPMTLCGWRRWCSPQNPARLWLIVTACQKLHNVMECHPHCPLGPEELCSLHISHPTSRLGPSSAQCAQQLAKWFSLDAALQSLQEKPWLVGRRSQIPIPIPPGFGKRFAGPKVWHLDSVGKIIQLIFWIYRHFFPRI